jgi:hypothetical protein
MEYQEPMMDRYVIPASGMRAAEAAEEVRLASAQRMMQKNMMLAAFRNETRSRVAAAMRHKRELVASKHEALVCVTFRCISLEPIRAATHSHVSVCVCVWMGVDLSLSWKELPTERAGPKRIAAIQTDRRTSCLDGGGGSRS